MESGRFISQQDINIIAKVCVLGQTVVTNLFGTLDPIDKWIRVNNIPFRVVGVLSAKGQSPTGQDQDDVVPYALYNSSEKDYGGDAYRCNPRFFGLSRSEI